MSIGYNTPLYLLPFDHRQSYVTGMFDFKLPLSQQQHDKVADSKQLIYEGFQEALQYGISTEYAGLLVDEEFGADVLRDAKQKGYITALSTEKSGSEEFDFEYGPEFAAHIEKFNPTFAKVLVRYNPEGDAALNQRQTGRLRQLSDYCHRTGRRFMFELLVPATEEQMQRVQGDKSVYDLRTRPELMLQAIQRLQEGSVEPDVWKIEGLDQRHDCERIVQMVQRDGRTEVGCIVLGRGANKQKVLSWLETAATVPGFIGFAIGRTSFWDAVADFESQRVTRREASAHVAARYAKWANIFEQRRRHGQSAAAGATRRSS